MNALICPAYLFCNLWESTEVLCSTEVLPQNLKESDPVQVPALLNKGVSEEIQAIFVWCFLLISDFFDA
jgi:hypothetical protein